MLPTCCNCFGWAVSANASVPGRRDCEVVLCSTVQGGEVAAAAAHTAAVVLAPSGVDRRHRVQHVRQRSVVPGDGHNAGVAVDGGHEGGERAGGWKEAQTSYHSKARKTKLL